MRAARRNLVFCRAGEGSLHRRWLGDPAARSYDVWLDCYCDPARWAGEPARVTDGRDATKWPRLARLLADEPGAFDGYDVVWVPDDDLDVDAAGVEAFLAAFHRHRLALAQPALADGCFWSHELTLENRGFALRYTNFVEVMAPAFSREALRACAPTFGANRSGWGLDLVWSRLLGDPRDAIAVVDAAPMIHTRPVGGGALYDSDRHWDDMRALAARHGVALPFRFRQYGGVPRASEGPPSSGLPFLARLLAGAPPSQRRRAHYWRVMAGTVAGGLGRALPR